jgi:hypothetical protein
LRKEQCSWFHRYFSNELDAIFRDKISTLMVISRCIAQNQEILSIKANPFVRRGRKAASLFERKMVELASPGNQAANRENKPQLIVSEETGLLDSFGALGFLFLSNLIQERRRKNGRNGKETRRSYGSGRGYQTSLGSSGNAPSPSHGF